MDCEEVRKYIHAFLDDELDVELNLDVLEHINLCPDCRARFEDEKNFKQLVENRLLSDSTPAGLHRQILHRVLGQRSGGPKWRRGVVTAVVLVGLLLAVAGLVYGVRRAVGSVQDSGVSSLMAASAERHQRYLRDDLPLEAASQDPKTLAGYFRTRLGLPVEVKPLTAQGFRLVGGRLCHLLEQPTACVIYQRTAKDKTPACTLSLYMLADRPALAPIEIQGNLAVSNRMAKPVALWRQDGIVSALVADATQEELVRLARTLQASTARHARKPKRQPVSVARP